MFLLSFLSRRKSDEDNVAVQTIFFNIMKFFLSTYVLCALFFAALVLNDSYFRFFATLFFEACYWALNNFVVLDRPMPPALENAVKTLRWSNPLQGGKHVSMIVVDLLGSLSGFL